jgi:hypothetical protein
MRDEDTGEEPRCDYCGAKSDCKHLLAVIDRSFLECYGGYAFDRFDEFTEIITKAFMSVLRTESYEHRWKDDDLNDLWDYTVENYVPDEDLYFEDEEEAEEYYDNCHNYEWNVHLSGDNLYDLIIQLFEDAGGESHPGSLVNGEGPGMTSTVYQYYAEFPQKVFEKALSILKKRLKKTLPKGPLPYPKLIPPPPPTRIEILNYMFSDYQAKLNRDIEGFQEKLELSKQKLRRLDEAETYLDLVIHAIDQDIRRTVNNKINFKTSKWQSIARVIQQKYLIIYYRNIDNDVIGEDKRSVPGHGGTAYYKSKSVEKATYERVKKSNKKKSELGISPFMIRILSEGSFNWLHDDKENRLSDSIIENLALIRAKYEKDQELYLED